MKLIGKIFGERDDVVAALKGKGINSKLVRGGVVVELPKQGDAYRIPEEIKNAKLFIDLSEHGGGMTNTGNGTVVCDLNGKPLKPYYIPRSGHLSCSDHAYFSVLDSVATVTGRKRSDIVEIRAHVIVVENDTARIVSQIVWSGEIESLPMTYDRYANAAKAAMTKANCYHCRCVHFASVQP